MIKAMGSIAVACGVYFVIGAAMTAGCILGAAAAEKIVERIEG